MPDLAVKQDDFWETECTEAEIFQEMVEEAVLAQQTYGCGISKTNGN